MWRRRSTCCEIHVLVLTCGPLTRSCAEQGSGGYNVLFCRELRAADERRIYSLLKSGGPQV